MFCMLPFLTRWRDVMENVRRWPPAQYLGVASGPSDLRLPASHWTRVRSDATCAAGDQVLAFAWGKHCSAVSQPRVEIQFSPLCTQRVNAKQRKVFRTAHFKRAQQVSFRIFQMYECTAQATGHHLPRSVTPRPRWTPRLAWSGEQVTAGYSSCVKGMTLAFSTLGSAPAPHADRRLIALQDKTHLSCVIWRGRKSREIDCSRVPPLRFRKCLQTPRHRRTEPKRNVQRQ